MTSERPLRVLSVIGQLNVGGAETYLSRIAHAVRRHNIDMEVCAIDRVGRRIIDLEEAGVIVHGTPFDRRTRQSNTLTLLQVVESIRRLVRRGRFDLVHTYLFWADIFGVTGARLAGCRRIIIGRRALHPWIHDHKALYHGVEQFTNTLANEVIGNSEAVLRDAAAHEPFLPRIRKVVYNGIDVSAYKPSNVTTDGPLRIVTVGALAPRKGQEYAIEAMKLVDAAGVDARLVLVGSGVDEAMLRRKVTESGMGDVITFAGEHPDPRAFLGEADLFLLPSRQEGFSNAILEAMACSLPVIATDVGGNAEAVVHGRGGSIVEPQNPEALAAAVIELAGKRAELPDMGRFNRERVAEHFSLEASARTLADWYFHGPSARAAGNGAAP